MKIASKIVCMHACMRPMVIAIARGSKYGRGSGVVAFQPFFYVLIDLFGWMFGVKKKRIKK